MSYYDTLNYVARKTLAVELCDQFGGRVLVCPEWNGRVLTSTFNGLQGDSFGCVNVQAIDDEKFESFGGEDQWTISPLIYSFVVETINGSTAVLQRTIQMTDADGVPVELKLSRSISLLDRMTAAVQFSDAVADSFEQKDVSVVGFRTENTVQSQDRACIASRLRGMFNAGSNTVIVLPALPEDVAVRSTPMEIDYLGGSPHGRIRHLPQTLLLRADGQGQCQITIPFFHAPPILGAVDFRCGTLALWTFDILIDSEQDAVRLYNSGQKQSGGLNGAAYYETNYFSSAQELLPGDLLAYCQSVVHLSADNEILDGMVRQLFDVSLDDVVRKMLR